MIQIPAAGLYPEGVPARATAVNEEEHLRRFPEGALVLPTGARRLLQRASGYDMKIVSGEVVMENNEPTGATPGRLLRGAQSL